MERDCSEKLDRKQIIKARGEYRDSLLEQGNTRILRVNSLLTSPMALNHVGRVLVKCVIIQLQLTVLQQKHVGKYLKFQVGP